jgi:hypothetical protein
MPKVGRLTNSVTPVDDSDSLDHQLSPTARSGQRSLQSRSILREFVVVQISLFAVAAGRR